MSIQYSYLSTTLVGLGKGRKESVMTTHVNDLDAVEDELLTIVKKSV